MTLRNTKIIALNLALLLMWICCIPSYSQSGITIPLNRILHPQFLSFFVYNKNNNSNLKDSVLNIIGGDYSDEDAEFTLALCDINNNGRYDDYDTDRFIIAPYKTDSIFVNPNPHAGAINYFKTFIIQIGDKEYQARINIDGRSIELTKILGNYLKPDLDFFDRLPALTYTNIYGDTVSFSSFEHKNKLIYVDFWETITENPLLVQDSLKEIYNKYKSALTIVSLDYADTNTDKVRNVIVRNHFEWEHGFAKFNYRWAFALYLKPFSIKGPYGALFDSNGKLIKLFEVDSPKNLELVLEERLGKK